MTLCIALLVPGHDERPGEEVELVVVFGYESASFAVPELPWVGGIVKQSVVNHGP